RWDTDGELAADLRARDGDAWAVTYVRFSASMRRLAHRLVSVDQADDVVHEVFARFWERPDLYDPARGSLRNYLLDMTRGRSIDAYRSDAARRGREIRDLDRRSSDFVVSIEADAIAGLTTDQLIIIIRMLPRGERQAIGLAFFRDLSYQQVAAALGLPEGTVKSRIRAGLARTRTALGELGLDTGTLPDENPSLAGAVDDAPRGTKPRDPPGVAG
nr:sigma-70 family RNA polymerase sigma factor [Acidimicrobiia bacterium]